MTLFAIKAFLRAVPIRTWLLIAAVALVAGAGLYARSHYIGVGEGRVQARWDAQNAVHAAQMKAATDAARKTEERHRAEYKAIAERFLKEQADADQAHQRTIADLRAGTVRLRQRFTCPPAAGVPGTPAYPGGADEEGAHGLQPEDAEFLVGEAERADAVARQLNALIEAVEAGRR